MTEMESGQMRYRKLHDLVKVGNEGKSYNDDFPIRKLMRKIANFSKAQP